MQHTRGELGFYGPVNASSPLGVPGNLLLDPVNVTISSAVTSANVPVLTCPFNQAFDGGSKNINDAELIACLGPMGGATSVTIDTSNFSGMDPGEAGTITIVDDVDYSSSASFTLIADQDIIINSDRKIENSNNMAGSLSLTAGRDIHFLGDGEIDWANGSVTLDAGNDLILDDTIGVPPLPPRTGIANSGGPIDITVGNDVIMGVETEIRGDSGGSVTMNVARDFLMADNAEVNANSNDLTVIVGRDILTSNNDNINNEPNFEVTGPGNLFIEAGCNWISTGSAFAQSNAGDFTLIVDNAPPNDFEPFEGDCGIIFNGDSQLRTTSGLLRIYTACHTKNDFSRTQITGEDGIQEDAFIGKPFENATFPPTNIEQWETWFTSAGQPDPAAGEPFRVFYKCQAPPPPPPPPPENGFPDVPTTIGAVFGIIGGLDPTFATGFIANSIAENLLPYDACAFDNCCNFFNPPYMMGYDRYAYECCKAKTGVLESYQVVCDTCYYMLNRAFIEYNTQGAIEWYNQKPWCCFQDTCDPCNNCAPVNCCESK